MSSIMAVEQHQDPRNQPAGSDSSMAPEHVLRAAALRSLKAKRKKQQTVSTELPSTLPPRPAPPPDSSSIQLDYGQAELPSSIASSSAPPPTSSKPETKMDVDDAAREEGEISDSEDAPTAPPSPVAPKQQPQAKKVPTPPAKPKPVPPKSPERKRVPTPPTPSTAVPRSSSITIETPRPTIFEPVIKASKALTDMLPPPLPIHHTSIVVDSYQARPGLNMTEVQFETAKDIVLDLLGWGVPPEYLVNCGLSREIIFYVFTELNLKYPSNFDFSDLKVPEPYLALASDTPSPSPPETMPYGDRAPYSPTSLTSGNYRPQGHPSLPQKPSAPQGANPADPTSPSKLSAGATPFVPTVSPKLDEASLLSMEQQRRQELLARKAAIASRRRMTTSSSASDTTPAPTAAPLSPTTLDAETMKSLHGILERAQSSSNVVPKETVDDFLKSIGPVADEKSETELEIPRVASPDAMDVDEIPGLTAVDPSLTHPLTANASLSSISSSQSIASSVPPPETPISDNQSFRASSSEGDRKDVESMMEVDESGSIASTAVNAGSRSSSSGQETGQSRRATKQRPVAADFVDMEPPRPPGYGHYREHPRKKTSFAGLITSRRMIIDVSDSEDDEVNAAWSSVTARYRPYPPNRSGLQSTAGSSRVSPRATTPAALLEKELEIKRMREMIAQREREKLKKLATSTTSTPPAPSTLSNEITVKQEEDDSAASASLLQVPRAALSEEPSREPTVPPSTVTTSPSPTPNDAPSQEWEDTPSIGERVLADTMQQPQAVAPSSQSSTPEASTGLQQQVDAVDSQRETSSAQEVMPNEQDATSEPSQSEGFIHYQSFLSQYPSLRVHLPLSGIQRTPIKQSEPLLDKLDLKPLKLVATYKWLEANTSRCLCQYEIPGGGECRDNDCQAIHLSKLSAIEPSDEETAEYLCSAMPTCSQFTVQILKTALEQSRQRHPASDFEYRVREAVASLGLR